MKIGDGEAVHLAALMIETCRTNDPKKQIEIEAWVKRLQGVKREARSHRVE